MTHTPGPWKINPRASMVVESESGRTIASCGGYASTSEDTMPENQANARLIAAAPSLLTAIYDAREIIALYIDEAGPCDHEANICICGVKSVLNEIDTVISKAGGPR